MKTERELFEGWVSNPFVTMKNLDPTSDKTYREPIAEFAWKAWQARVPEGYAVVPKEPTERMIDVGMGSFCFPLDNGRFSNHDLIFAYRAMLEAVEK